jgi:hypothetical protein
VLPVALRRRSVRRSAGRGPSVHHRRPEGDNRLVVVGDQIVFSPVHCQ